MGPELGKPCSIVSQRGRLGSVSEGNYKRPWDAAYGEFGAIVA